MQHLSNKSAQADLLTGAIPSKRESVSAQHYAPSPCPKNVNEPPPCESLIEYLSRPARKQIVGYLTRALLESSIENGDAEMGRKKRGRPYSSGASLLAVRLGISRKSVDRWLNGVMQSSNHNAVKIVDLARKFVPEELEAVLWEDVERHIEEVKGLFNGHGGGVQSSDGKRSVSVPHEV